MKSLYQKMQYWYNSPLGHLLLEVESNGLRSFLEEIFGYYVLQLGVPRQIDLLKNSPIGHKIYYAVEGDYPNMIHGKFTELSFLPNSIDLVIVPHVLEFSKQPQKILSEIYHALIPEGHLIIVGFNPFSLWGLIRLFKKHNTVPWGGKFVSIFHMRHSLSHIGFKIIEHKTFFFRPPLLNKKTLHKMLFMEGLGQLLWPYCGAVYILVAKKTVISLTPIKQKRHLVRQRVPADSYVKPSARIQK